MYVISLQGGGWKGAFQVPVIKALMKKREPDLILGVSVGAINGILAAQHDFKLLDDLWSSIDDATPLDGIKGFMSPAFFRGKALFHLGPLRKKLETETSLDKLKVPFGAGVVVRETGDYLTLLSDKMSKDSELHDAVHGSSAIAGLMEPVSIKIKGKHCTLSDGGHLHSIPVLPEWVEKQVTHVDLILTHPVHEVQRSTEEVNGLLESLEWALSITSQSVQSQGLAKYRALRRRHDTTVRVFAPQEDLGSILKADRQTLKWRYQLGRQALKDPIIWAPPLTREP